MQQKIEHHHLRTEQLYSWEESAYSLSLCAEYAERLSIPWGIWQQNNKLYACFGGTIESYDPDKLKTFYRGVDALKVVKGMGMELQEGYSSLKNELPRYLILRRFFEKTSSLKPVHSQTNDIWEGWGKLGSFWKPIFSLCYDFVDKKGILARFDDGAEEQLFVKLFSCYSSMRKQSIENFDLTEKNKLEFSPQETYESWTSRLDKVLNLCQSGKLSKAVLARSWLKIAHPKHYWSGAALWYKSTVSAQASETVFAFSLAPQVSFVGVSPECLFELKGDQITTHALAGTRALRSKDIKENDPEYVSKSHELLHSEKDLIEHHLVVEQLKKTLEKHCSTLNIKSVKIKKARKLIHLETEINGMLNSDINGIDLLEKLHPTPALGGTPKALALSLIQKDEPMVRGGYAAPWMWIDQQQKHCAIVGIRSVLLQKDQAYIFAGAGIVPQSNIDEEWQETKAKAEVIGHLLTKDIQRKIVTSTPSLDTLASSSLARCLSLVETLKNNGLAGVVLSPGSRNTPLALALEALLPSCINIDERSAGFTALGWAKALGQPIALCCTSGSAASHYLPSLIEAHYSAVPLLVLTADRPPRLRGKGAPQTISQQGLFGSYCKYSYEVPVEEKVTTIEEQATLKEIWNEQGLFAVEHTLLEPAGVVHLNVPFEEPLWDHSSEELLHKWSTRRLNSAGALDDLNKEKTPPYFTKRFPKLQSVYHLDKQGIVEKVAEVHQLFRHRKGVLYCGPLNPNISHKIAPLLRQISQSTSWPIFAEASSQIRDLIPESLTCLDAFTRYLQRVKQGESTFSKMDHDIRFYQEVEVVITIGTHTHSRAIRSWFEQCTQAQFYWFGDGPETVDPSDLNTKRIGRNLTTGMNLLSEGLATHIEVTSYDRALTKDSWYQTWKTKEAHWRAYLLQVRNQELDSKQTLWGGLLGLILKQKLVEHQKRLNEEGKFYLCDLIVASSMAFRDHDMTWVDIESNTPQENINIPTEKESIQVSTWVNRGANGIDGTFSTALGVALARKQRLRSQSYSKFVYSTPLIIWLGDLATHHDLQGLHKLSQWYYETQDDQDPIRPIIVLMTNNNGGGIFKHLPIRQSRRYERLFQTPLHLQSHEQSSPWSALVQWANAKSYTRITCPTELNDELDMALERNGLSFIEVLLEAQVDYEKHLSFWQASFSSSQMIGKS